MRRARKWRREENPAEIFLLEEERREKREEQVNVECNEENEEKEENDS